MATETPSRPEPRQPESSPAPEVPPRLAEGIELIGQFEDSGFKDPPYIARRSDGQVIQLPQLLYVVAEQVDGQRDYDQVADRVTQAFERQLGGDDVRFLVDEKLRPLGVLAAPDGSSPKVEKVDPLLALKFKTKVVPERFVQVITTIFRPLFFPPVVIAAIAGLLALDVWLFFMHGISQSIRATIYQPALLLVLLLGVVVATAFHEIGHASACRYGGAKPGVMGVGIYVVWPAFYTDVTDAYRLGRGGRLRTDLGGIYFNGLFALLLAGGYFLTGFEPLLLLVLLQHFAVLQQLLPLLRLDGYYIISDLSGVPDMFSRIRPTLASLLPGRETDPRVEELKPRVRRVVTTYVMIVVPLLVLATVLMIAQAPRAFATAYDSLGLRYDQAGRAFGAGRTVTGVGNVLQMLALTLPLAGMVLTTGRIGKRAGGAAWSWSDGEPARRAMVLVPAVAAVGLAAFVWWPNGDYRPIQPGERGTVQAGVRSLEDIPTGRPSLTPERQRELGGALDLRSQERDQDPAQTPAEREREESEGQDGAATTPQGTTPAPSAIPSAEPGEQPGATSTPAPAAPAPSETPTPSVTPEPTEP